MEELQEREEAESQRMKEQLCEVEQKLKEQLQEQVKAREAELEAEKLDQLEMAQRLHGSEEERKSLTQERDDLKQQRDSLQTEREVLGKQVEEATCKVRGNEQYFSCPIANLTGKVERVEVACLPTPGPSPLACPLKMRNGDPDMEVCRSCAAHHTAHYPLVGMLSASGPELGICKALSL